MKMFDWLRTKQSLPRPGALPRKAPTPPQIAQGRYYCDGTHDSAECLKPRLLSDMEFGCADCSGDEWLDFGPWLELTKSDSRHERNLEKLAQIEKDPSVFRSASITCSKHGLVTRSRCKWCDRILALGDSASPVSLVGAVRAGKSVYSAVLAHELGRKDEVGLFQLTGMSCTQRGTGHKSYWTSVVVPLMERGELPQKTFPNTYNKAIFHLQDVDQGGWLPRTVMFTDVSGEVYDDQKTPVIGALRTSLLWSREMILLIDPANTGSAGGMGGRIESDFGEVAERIVRRLWSPIGAGSRDVGHVVNLIEAVEDVLRVRQWPSIEHGEAARAIVDRLHLEGVPMDRIPLTIIEHELATLAAARAIEPSNSDIVKFLTDYIRNQGGVELVHDKLPYTVAVAVTKSDLLGDDWAERPRMVRRSLTEWRRVLAERSAMCRQRLKTIGVAENQLVNELEENFANVGYFFVSSLGAVSSDTHGRRPLRTRRTDVKIIRETVAISSASGDEASTYGQRATTAPSAQEAAVGWRRAKVVSEGDDGTRRPRPLGVVDPLLWIISGASLPPHSSER